MMTQTPTVTQNDWLQTLKNLCYTIQPVPGQKPEGYMEVSYSVKILKDATELPLDRLEIKMGQRSVILTVDTETSQLLIYQPPGMRRGQLIEALNVAKQILENGTIDPSLAEKEWTLTVYEAEKSLSVQAEPVSETLETLLNQKDFVLPTSVSRLKDGIEQVADIVSPERNLKQFWEKFKNFATSEKAQKAYQNLKELSRNLAGLAENLAEQTKKSWFRTKEFINEATLITQGYLAARAVRCLGNMFTGSLHGVSYTIEATGMGNFTLRRETEDGKPETILSLQQDGIVSPPIVSLNRQIPDAELYQLLKHITQQATLAYQQIQAYGSMSAFLAEVSPQKAAQALGGFTPPETMTAAIKAKTKTASSAVDLSF